MFTKPRFQYVALVLLAASCSRGCAQAAGGESSDVTADEYRSNPKFVDAMKEGKDLEHHKQPAFASDDYKKANKIAGGLGRCVDGGDDGIGFRCGG
jgi:hypothetical protein